MKDKDRATYELLVAIVILLTEVTFGLLIWNYVLSSAYGVPVVAWWQMFMLVIFVRMILPAQGKDK